MQAVRGETDRCHGFPVAALYRGRQGTTDGRHRLHRRAPSLDLHCAAPPRSFGHERPYRSGARSAGRPLMRNRMMKPLQWLIPGLGIKRWLLLAFFGLLILLDGVDRWLVAEGVSFPFNEIIDNIVDDYF